MSLASIPLQVGIVAYVLIWIFPLHEPGINILFSTFMILWAATMLKMWRRKASRLPNPKLRRR